MSITITGPNAPLRWPVEIEGKTYLESKSMGTQGANLPASVWLEAGVEMVAEVPTTEEILSE